MTAPPGDLIAYHVGIVVHDLEAVAQAYQRMLGVDRWRTHELDIPKVPFDARSTNARLKIAFGRGAGLTFELIQVLEDAHRISTFSRSTVTAFSTSASGRRTFGRQLSAPCKRAVE